MLYFEDLDIILESVNNQPLTEEGGDTGQHSGACQNCDTDYWLLYFLLLL